MNALVIGGFLAGLSFCIVQSLPVAERNSSPSSDQVIVSGATCNDVDEIISSDPCKPLCACKDGRIYCADIICSTENLPIEQCHKLPLNGKCCPSYLCTNGNGTHGDVHYPLPLLIVPPELNLSTIPSSKNDLLHKGRRP